MNSIVPNKRVVAIIQARMGSTRFPGKTLVHISGKPLLAHIIERIRCSRIVDEVVIATTTSPEDHAIVKLASEFAIRSYAGSAEDVLDRYYQAAKFANAAIIVRITADDPFKDPEVLDKIATHLLSHPDLDYVSNTIEPTYPEGLDIEVFTFLALERAWQEAKLPSEREHVTPYIWKNPRRFRVANIKHCQDLSHLRWTLDYNEDLLFTRGVYARLASKSMFFMRDILELLEIEPSLSKINKGIERNAGYKASLQRDSRS